MSKSIRIDDDIHYKAKVESAKDGVTVQKWISDIIRKELKIRESKNRTSH